MTAGALYLTDDQLDQLADRIADRLADRQVGQLITAAELADRLGVTRDYVYEHAASLGAIRLGDGPRPRLAFRWPQVLDQLHNTEPARPTVKPTPRRRRPAPASTAPLLEIRP